MLDRVWLHHEVCLIVSWRQIFVHYLSMTIMIRLCALLNHAAIQYICCLSVCYI